MGTFLLFISGPMSVSNNGISFELNTPIWYLYFFVMLYGVLLEDPSLQMS